MPLSFAERLEREITDQKLTAEARARLDDWLAADKAFNVWFLVTTKRALKDAELSALLDGYQESQEIAEAAWEAFETKADPAALLAGLERSIAKMEQVRASI